MSHDPSPTMASNLLPQIFTSLGRSSRPWSLTRILKSTNTRDIQGELTGTATFRPLRTPSPSPSPSPDQQQQQQPDSTADMVYREEGEMPATLGLGAGLRFSKKYIWRMSESGRVSVWFAKVQKADAQDGTEEPDYLFHEFEVAASAPEGTETVPLVSAPIPPPGTGGGEDTSSTTVVAARGNHLCINDMYHTAYAFRIRSGSGEVVSWSSRHVVKGPKKDQDIVNVYRREG